eukprot:TRINITY_DN1216_c0_g5_i2.p2 TRINITY_DN1216_c0_g5~~TRINITY_DN1216_c0_g5_i2.p2  ORF type:complete len:113 (-),score=18.35 TRINITY_DN1216_c0_g5_i2:304-642(-)
MSNIKGKFRKTIKNNKWQTARQCSNTPTWLKVRFPLFLDMQQDAIDISTQAMEKYSIEKDIAAYIKKEFDKKYSPTWHCVVGRNFGSYVTHETKHFIYFYLGQVAILLFKSG